MLLKPRRLMISHLIIVINVLIFTVMLLTDPSLSNLTLVQFGAKYNPLIEAGQIYRLVTAAFLHVDIPHLLFNSFALYIIGPAVESLFGKSRFLLIYLGSAVMGTAMSYAFSSSISAGASGAIFGLLGAHVYLFLRKPSAYLKLYGKDFLIMIGLNLLIGFSTSNIDNFGHIGGLIGGVLIAPLTGISGEKFPRIFGLLTASIYLFMIWLFL